MVSYVVLAIACIAVGAISSMVTLVVERRDIDGILRIITADYEDETYMALEAHKEVSDIVKKKHVRFKVRPEHYRAQD